MKLISVAFLLFNLLLLTACSENEDTIDNNQTIQLTEIELGNDNSYSNTTNVIAKSLHLELDINFENKSIYGVARHTLSKHSTDTIVFDVNGLQIQKVTIGDVQNEKNTDYVLGIEDSIHGAPLSVKITKNTHFVNIYYQTTEKSSNLHWITDSSQTTPFIYSSRRKTYKIMDTCTRCEHTKNKIFSSNKTRQALCTNSRRTALYQANRFTHLFLFTRISFNDL